MDAVKTMLKMNATFASVASFIGVFQRVMHRKAGLHVLDTLCSHGMNAFISPKQSMTVNFT